jgi:hypothetical protein
MNTIHMIVSQNYGLQLRLSSKQIIRQRPIKKIIPFLNVFGCFLWIPTVGV